MELQAIAFDADDTLWHNEDGFAATEAEFAGLVSSWASADDAHTTLFATETRNIGVYGYGVKAFTLSMIEAAVSLSNGRLDASVVTRIVELGRSMLERPAELLPGVEATISLLHDAGHRLLIVTKGDLHHQERKAIGSGLERYVDAVEVVSEKDPDTYRRVVKRHDIDPTRLVMVGNSVKSDILPVVEIGGIGIHIPYSVTWAHEHVDPDHLHAYDRNCEGSRYWELARIDEVPNLIDRLITESIDDGR